MPAIRVSQALNVSGGAWNEHVQRRPWLRSLLFVLFFLVSLAFYGWLIAERPPDDVTINPFVTVWMYSFLPYFAACALVLLTKPTVGRWLWVELGIIFGGALVFRALLLPLPPGLSRDAWRYLWDARVTLHGYSPYVYAPGASIFKFLQDPVIYANMRFRNVPTLYPPAAQAVFLLSYALAPSNLYFMKGVFIVFDMGTCVALALLLRKRRLDPRRAVLYAWCPLPIVEFAIQGHVDVITLPFLILAVLCALSNWRGARVLTGFLIGVATLTKIYPIFLLIVVVRRRQLLRDWTLLVTCLATIAVGYLPYLILGNGQIFGFFSSFASEQGGNSGIIPLLVNNIYGWHHFTLPAIISAEHVVDALAVVVSSLIVFFLRMRERISMEAASMVLIGVIFAISSHVFPWYITALLPFIAVLVGPTVADGKLSGRGIAVAAAWFFVVISPIGYFFTRAPSWQEYYVVVYCVVIAFLAIAAGTAIAYALEGRVMPPLTDTP